MQRFGAALGAAEDTASEPLSESPLEESRSQRPARDPGQESASVGLEQGILQREDRLEAARVALPTGSSRELSVDARRIMTLGPQDGEPAQLGHALGERDVGSRPAMFVATVTQPRSPARATIPASPSSCFAVRT